MGNILLGKRAGFYHRYAVFPTNDIPEWQTVGIYTKGSTIRGHGEGIFAGDDIPEGVIFGSTNQINADPEKHFVESRDILFAVDPLLKHEILQDSHSSVEFYNKLHWACREYHDEELASQKINMRLLGVPKIPMHDIESIVLYASALRPIAKDEEIFRCHGFSAWLRLCTPMAKDLILANINRRNIVGFIVFLRDWLADPQNSSDPLREGITRSLAHFERHFEYITQTSGYDAKILTPEEWDRHCATVALPQEPLREFHKRVFVALRIDEATLSVDGTLRKAEPSDLV